MTIQQFGDATHYVQRTILQMHGVYLLTKKTRGITASLYQVDNFYVEVIKSSLPDTTPLIKSYSVKEEELDDYLNEIDLSSIQHLLK